MRRSSMAAQGGFTLMEALVALLVAAVGALAVLGTQLKALGQARASVQRAQAIQLIEDLSERMRAHPNALAHIENYAADWGSGSGEAAPEPLCSAGCTPEQLARYDLWAWRQNVATMLPDGHAAIFLASAAGAEDEPPRQIGVVVGWREPRDARAAEDNEDAAFFAPIDAVQHGGGISANASACGPSGGFTCHLQYLAAPARCAPYRAGASVLYYCAGF